MTRYAIGLDYGTNSCRALLVNLATGEELAQSVFAYPSGEMGVLVDAANPHVARQSAADYLLGLESCLVQVLKAASAKEAKFSAQDVVGIGVDSTGSTPIPVDGEGVPLEFDARWKKHLAAYTWLWKDHTSYAEAAEITRLAKQMRPQYLAKCGGAYSSEWFWAKLWHCKKENPEVFAAAKSWVELCDWLPAVLSGNTHPSKVRRGICAAGHKAMFNASWGGLPDKEFLTALDPDLAALRDRLYSKAYPADEKAGTLSAEWAKKTGLREGIAIAVGAFDAHMGAVGAGVQEGALVKILGTSTCDIMVWPTSKPLADIPGVCGVVEGSVMGGHHGIEAGQSAVGDLFLWFVHQGVPDRYGKTMDEKFVALEKGAGELKAGETGLLALDWNNGNRTILVDQRLTGLMLGQTLHTEAHEQYRALMEATAFGALRIIERVEESGVPIREVINCGGLADKNPVFMQIYADVTGRPMKVARSTQTCALGAAIFGAVAAGEQAGGFASVAEAQKKLSGMRDRVFVPNAKEHAVYRKLYGLYRDLHDAFGFAGKPADLFHVMKDLLAIREKVAADRVGGV